MSTIQNFTLPTNSPSTTKYSQQAGACYKWFYCSYICYIHRSIILHWQKRTIRRELMSLTIYEANYSEEPFIVKCFSFHFNFLRKKEDNFKKEARKRRFWKKRGKRGGVGCQYTEKKKKNSLLVHKHSSSHTILWRENRTISMSYKHRKVYLKKVARTVIKWNKLN